MKNKIAYFQRVVLVVGFLSSACLSNAQELVGEKPLVGENPLDKGKLKKEILLGNNNLNYGKYPNSSGVYFSYSFASKLVTVSNQKPKMEGDNLVVSESTLEFKNSIFEGEIYAPKNENLDGEDLYKAISRKHSIPIERLNGLKRWSYNIIGPINSGKIIDDRKVKTKETESSSSAKQIVIKDLNKKYNFARVRVSKNPKGIGFFVYANRPNDKLNFVWFVSNSVACPLNSPAKKATSLPFCRGTSLLKYVDYGFGSPTLDVFKELILTK